MTRNDDELFDDDVFDAMLRVALTEGEASVVRVGARPRNRLESGCERSDEMRQEPPRSRFTPWLVAAGLVVCVGVWWSNLPVGGRPAGEESPKVTAQDPVPRESEPMTPEQFAAIVASLGIPAQRPAAVRDLVGGGSIARDHLVRRLASEPESLANEEPNPILEGLLLATSAFGRHSAAFVPVVEGRLADFHADQMLAALELFAEAALWTAVPPPDGEVGEDFLNIYGHDFDGLELVATNRCMVAFRRRDAREIVRQRAEAGQLLAALDQGKGRRCDPASVRLAALHRLAVESDLPPSAWGAIERVLTKSHPPFLVLGWKVGGATMVERESDSAIHRAAAKLLIDRVPTEPASVLAHAHCVRTFDDLMTRRRSALALGQLLVDSAVRTGSRVDEAVAALRVPLAAVRSGGARVDSAATALAGDAATALAMIGPSAQPALADLEALADHGNSGLAKRVKSAIRRIGSR